MKKMFQKKEKQEEIEKFKKFLVISKFYWRQKKGGRKQKNN